MTELSTSATLEFVNRLEEMERIRNALKAAKDRKGQLLVVRGEAGSGKTRLMQEARNEAEKLGFGVGFGTALTESVTLYHLWKDVLVGLELGAILEEKPPPKLLGLYVLNPEGSVLTRAEREDTDKKQLSHLVKMLEKIVREPPNAEDCEWTEGRLSSMCEKGNKVILSRASDFTVGAVIEGQENERFLADLQELSNSVASLTQRTNLDDGNANEIKPPLQQLLDSRKYEGIDYVLNEPKLRQSRFFDYVTLGLARKSDIRPVLVMLDDMHWADPSSLALLHYLSRNTKNKGVLLLCTYRIEEAKARVHLVECLNGMKEEELLEEMDLKGLSREDLPDLANSFIGAHDLKDDFLDLLWQETQGNPLFVGEVLKGLEGEDAIAIRGAVKRLVRPLDQLAIPERVREVIRVRLKRLPEEDRRLLDAAATCGTRFTAALVAKVAGEDEIKVLNGLKAITKVHGLLRPVDSSFTFDHPAVQEVLYDGVPIETRRNYHKEAAEWLELAGGPVEDIGEHYYHAKDLRAASKLQEAAEVACKKYANDEAIRFFNEALEFEENPTIRLKIFRSLADVYHLTGDYGRSLRSYHSALELSKTNREKAGIEIKIGDVYACKGEYHTGLRYCNEALKFVKDEGCEEEVSAYNTIGNLILKMGDSNKALEFQEQGLSTAKRIGDRKLQALCLGAIGTTYSEMGTRNLALENLRSALSIMENLGDQKNIAAMLNNIGLILKDQGEQNVALGHFRKAVNISERMGHLRFLAKHLNNIGLIYSDLGDGEQALAYQRKALTINEKIREPDGSASNLLNIGVIHMYRGDYDQALEFLEKCRIILEKTGTRMWLAESYVYIGNTHLLKGDFKKALEYAGMGHSLAKKTGRKCDIGWAKHLAGKIYREWNKWVESMKNFEESLAIFKDIGFVYGEADTLFEYGLMWRARGETPKAIECFKSAFELFKSLNVPWKADMARKALDVLDAKS